jgi:uncharacterized protein YndB with AHSA1/START domain
MDQIERTVLLPAPPAEVWRALTESDELSVWFGSPVELEPWPGGRVTVGDGASTRRGLVEDFEPHRRLSIRWLPELGHLAHRSRVEFTLQPATEGTLLTVVEAPMWRPDAGDLAFGRILERVR